jgi:hypothetical protein
MMAVRHRRQPSRTTAYYDIALRDFGLLLGPVALTRLAWVVYASQTGPARRLDRAVLARGCWTTPRVLPLNYIFNVVITTRWALG